jgi:hypothetical protein
MSLSDYGVKLYKQIIHFYFHETLPLSVEFQKLKASPISPSLGTYQVQSIPVTVREVAGIFYLPHPEQAPLALQQRTSLLIITYFRQKNKP